MMKRPEEILGSDLVPGSKYERTMLPGESFQLIDHELKSDATYLGIIADFHSPAKDGWQQVIPVDSDLKQVRISVHENSVSFSKN
jgi:type VI secretion system VasD/TssJ family lipoprotein